MPGKGQYSSAPIIGETHNRLTVIRDLKRMSNGKHLVECACICGKTKICRIDTVRYGDTKSCGCIRRPNIKGKKYGYLTAIKYAGENRNGDSIWTFRCTCRNLVNRIAAQAKAKNTLLHCGCKKLKPNEAAFNALFGHYKDAAKFRKISFSLSRRLFKKLTESKCYYCGTFPSAIIKGPSNDRPYVYTGIDRVNNKIGYTNKNSVPCCKVCNVAKATYTYEFFIDWTRTLYLNLKKKGAYVKF